MAIIQIPYEFKNGIQVNDCGTATLTISIPDFDLCGDKYFELRITGITESDGITVTNFQYQQDIYGVTSLTTEALITLLATAFQCPQSYGCPNQNSSFNWELTPLKYEKYTSTTILDDTQVAPPNRTYTITTLTVNAVNYGVLPHTIWDDAVEGEHACDNANSYFQEIIDYLATLSIPEFVGGINLGINGATDNFQGVGLLELYFESGIVVTMNIASTSGLTGTFTTTGTDVVGMLQLELTNTSTIDAGDILETTNYIVSDNNTEIGNTTSPDATIFPYSIFCVGCGLNTLNSWVLNQVIITEQGCARDNMSTGFITTTQISSALSGNTINGNSIA